MSMKTIIGVNGAGGRMGQRIVQLAYQDPDLAIGAALEGPDHPALGKDIGALAGTRELGVRIGPAIPRGASLHLLIDFSLPEGTMAGRNTRIGRNIPQNGAMTGHS